MLCFALYDVSDLRMTSSFSLFWFSLFLLPLILFVLCECGKGVSLASTTARYMVKYDVDGYRLIMKWKRELLKNYASGRY